jgi:hypothetical protein
VCDNAGAWRYFTAAEIPVGRESASLLALCEDALRDLERRQEIALEVQRKVRRHYTYLHTVVKLLMDVDSAVSAPVVASP